MCMPSVLQHKIKVHTKCAQNIWGAHSVSDQKILAHAQSAFQQSPFKFSNLKFLAGNAQKNNRILKVH